jgi:PPOX class probable F420-dependent enzyme
MRARRCGMIEISGRGVAAGQDVGFPGKYLSVTSFRRDGTPVATPVWFVEEEGRLLVETDADSFKVRRIRRNPTVLVAPCSATGRRRGKQRKAHAEILGPDALAPVRDRMARKYRWDRVFVLPIYRAVQRLRRKPTGRGTSVVLEITPEP